MITQDDWSAILLTLKLATVVTLLLTIVATPLAWWLARTHSRWRPVVSAIVALPLVLPPTVIGFYLLLAFSPNSAFAKMLGWIGLERVAFSFEGLVIGSLVYSLPFVVQPLQNSMAAIESELLEAAASLGASAWDRFRQIVVPLSIPGYVIGATLGFAHTIGEFGIVLMIGGNIPEETRLVSIAIYDHAEGLNFASAHRLSAIMLGVSFVTLLVVFVWQARSRTNVSRLPEQIL